MENEYSICSHLFHLFFGKYLYRHQCRVPVIRIVWSLSRGRWNVFFIFSNSNKSPFYPLWTWIDGFLDCRTDNIWKECYVFTSNSFRNQMRNSSVGSVLGIKCRIFSTISSVDFEHLKEAIPALDTRIRFFLRSGIDEHIDALYTENISMKTMNIFESQLIVFVKLHRPT